MLLVCTELVLSLASSATAISTAAQVSGQRLTPEPKIVQVHWSPALELFVLTNQAGELFSIRGVNYNTHYTRLPKEEYVSILRKDFQQMRDAGVNVITGYATFDETTLQVAKEYGL